MTFRLETRAAPESRDVHPLRRHADVLTPPDVISANDARIALQSTRTNRLFAGDASRPPPSDATLVALAPSVIPAVARGATDSAEKVRESCFALVAQYVARCAGALGPVLKTLVPALTRAMGAGSEEEPSEEIRLARATLVGEICACSKDSDVLASFADEMADVIASATRDPFHDVKKATHRAVEAFVEGLTEGNESDGTKSGNESGNESGEVNVKNVNVNASVALKKHARALCAAVLPDARHRHSQTRLSCLRAVSSLVPFLSVADMEELVAPGLQPMCADRTPGVRLALHEALARWMVADRTSDVENASSATLRDSDVENGLDVAMRDAEANAVSSPPACALALVPCLLPMLLTGVADETDANAANAARLVEAAGAANDGAVNVNDAKGDDEKKVEEAFANDAASAFLPHPFDIAVPGAASRRLVASQLPTLFPLAIRETREWTAARRNAGARLLGTALVYAGDETASSPFLPKIVGALIDAVTDDDKDTAERVLVAARALGAFAPRPETSWIPLLADALAGDAATTTPTRRAAALVTAAAAIRATPPARVTAAACRALADALASAHVLGSFDDAAVRAQCLSAAANLVDVAGRAGALKDGGASDAAAKEGASASLFRVLLQTRAAESPEGGAGETGVREAGHAGPATSTAPGALPPRERSASASAMAALARARGFERVDALYLAHARDALASALSDAEIAWDAPNPSQRAFCAFFLDAPVSVFAEAAVADKTLAVFATAGERTRDPALRAAMLRAMDAAFEEPPPEPESPNDFQTNRGGALVGGLETRAVAILETVVFESLVWRAGATEAAARYAAVVCLGTMLRRSLFASRSGFGEKSSKDASSKAPPLLVSRKALGLVLRRDLVLAPVFSAMEEDYYADTRLAACYALDGILATIGVDLGDERRRAAYPEILKRMDDSRDDVRVAAARCARRFFSDACPTDWDETNCLYFLKPFVVHMDDANERVCDAALDAVLAAAAVKPNAVVEALAPARETHRRVGHVERALDAARAALESR